METKDLFEILSRKVAHKVDIYLDQSKIDNYFKDQGFIVNEMSQSKKHGKELGIGVFKIISGKVTGGKDIAEKIIIDARDKVKIIEKISLNETGSITNIPNELFHYKGPGHFTYWEDHLNLYEQNQNELIQNERKWQEKISEKDTALFTFKIQKTLYASIANKDKFILNTLASYGTLDSFGILGLIEKKLAGDIILINPFCIWYENFG